MPTSLGPKISSNNNLVFSYDTGDTINSYIGEPTTNNYNSSFKDFSGTTYAPLDQWSNTTLTKIYYSDLPTPLGLGATLIEESTISGNQCLTRYGGGSESGEHTLSAYVYPLNNVDNFTIGLLGDSGNMIYFNLVTKTITYGAGITNGNGIIQPIEGWPGWYRVGANFEGRVGGWVGAIGYNAYTQYAGSGTLKKMYITNVQYEYKNHVTPFTSGTRSTTNSLFQLTNNSSIELDSVSFTNTAQIAFDGTDDKISIPDSTDLDLVGNMTIETLVSLDSTMDSQLAIIVNKRYDSDNTTPYTLYFDDRSGQNAFGFYIGLGSTSANSYIINSFDGVYNKFNHVVGVVDGTTINLYVNGVLKNSVAFIGTRQTNNYPVRLGGDYTYSSNNYMMAGKINICKIYNTALSPQEIQQNYQQYKTRFNL